MTRQEFVKIMAFVSAAVDKPISRATVEAYYITLNDLPYDLTMAAMQKIIAVSEYPTIPTIGKIRTAAAEINEPNRITAPEAWGIASRAVQKYGRYNEAEAHKSMEPNVSAVVRMIGWDNLCQSENIDVIRAQFMRMYETQENKRRENTLLPPAVKEYISHNKTKTGIRQIAEVNPKPSSVAQVEDYRKN